MSQITSLEQLNELYDKPHPLALDKEINQLEQHAIRFIEHSPFALISTTDPRGFADISPRGGNPDFIKVLDNNTIAFADAGGNNRLDSLKNIIANAEIGVLLMIPGIGEVLRLKGTATLHTDNALLEQFTDNKTPKLVVKIHVNTLYFHCPRAIALAKIWHQDSHIDRAFLPSLLRIIQDQSNDTQTQPITG
ncbi:pyridoxamine 5'-phosphate oxidase family protein [Marinomonas sp. M1K-6]|uniref:Pyridoxamine 5'-phosphate oxidase family protein n=1 Tax=Marinomonas profundi TaxID=2726122 RepID=A0A847R7J7_9GAMM|nr:MSMEG_1061 family FMN-dependent PPOX-type flavoprotein [Marinomonas profundi]NLQ18056.1 pyridoxamine 5'-phosphate oxidase family protein [Marinomonas profundi]UDV04156.1 pyridoxamine 5'-phosphate oxidase family protein [Marinomonas profundi]